MAYTNETQFNSPNYTAQAQVAAVFGYSRGIDYITIHWWGDPATNPSYEGVVSWLCNARSQVSAHEVATGTNRRVATIVDYWNAAWHAGNALGNARSVGIECDPRARPEDYSVVAELIADIWKTYGRIVPLRGHNSWTSTRCPGSYDLIKLHNMALSIYQKPVVVTATADQVREAYLTILERVADAGGINHYTTNGMTIEQVRADLYASQEYKDLQAKKAAEYAKNEWVRNLVPYTSGDDDFSDAVDLFVLPAEGARRYNLENGTAMTAEVIPKGTAVSIVAMTRVNGVDYYISSYAKKNLQAVGLRAAELGVPVVPTPPKPEWLENLQDIADQDFWTRSETPVLRLSDGTVLRTLPINTVVRVTHATEVVGKDLMVLDGSTEAIEVLYLSDKAIVDPYADLEKRVSALEAAVKIIWEFLSSVFLGFKR